MCVCVPVCMSACTFVRLFVGVPFAPCRLHKLTHSRTQMQPPRAWHVCCASPLRKPATYDSQHTSGA